MPINPFAHLDASLLASTNIHVVSYRPGGLNIMSESVADDVLVADSGDGQNFTLCSGESDELKALINIDVTTSNISLAKAQLKRSSKILRLAVNDVANWRALLHAARARLVLINSVEARENAVGTVLAPALGQYRAKVAQGKPPLQDLTSHLLDAADETRHSIEERMRDRWGSDESSFGKSVTNSLRRSAGTNFQTLVAVALADELNFRGSCWYVEFPVPVDFKSSLAIDFGVQLEAGDQQEDGSMVPANIAIEPDLDILLRNASWSKTLGAKEPIFVLSVKTSIADRGGQAARWKTYFDLVTRPCAHAHEGESCAWNKFGISLAQPLSVEMHQGIVSANIYKVNSDDNYRTRGELGTAQVKSNTFMFDYRFTTREGDEPALVPRGWQPLADLPNILAGLSVRHGLAM